MRQLEQLQVSSVKEVVAVTTWHSVSFVAGALVEWCSVPIVRKLCRSVVLILPPWKEFQHHSERTIFAVGMSTV